MTTHGINVHEMEVYKNTSVEKWLKEVFDAYLFFSPKAIENYKASGNFPAPGGQIMTVGENTAWAAWKMFPNTVKMFSGHEELSFVQYAVNYLMNRHNDSVLWQGFESKT